MLQITPDGFVSPLHDRTEDKDTNLVRRVRSKYKLSQAQLGYLLGIGAQTIHKWEHGKSGISRNMMMQLEGLEQGYALPDHIRDKYVKKPRINSTWRKVSRKNSISLSLTDTLLNRKHDGS